MSRTEETNNAACPITATETLGLHSAFLLTHVDQSANMKMPASLSSDLYRHRIGTRYFLHWNPQWTPCAVDSGFWKTVTRGRLQLFERDFNCSAQVFYIPLGAGLAAR